MTEYIEKLLDRFVIQKEQKKYRKNSVDPYNEAKKYCEQNLSDLKRSVRRMAYMLESETPVVYPDEKIALVRTVPAIPEIFTEEEWKQIRGKYYIHEQGKVCNISPDYSVLLEKGFAKVKDEILQQIKQTDAEDKKDYLNAIMETLEIIEAFAEKYRVVAEKAGNQDVAESFRNIPGNAPSNLKEALQFLRLIHYCLWCSFNYHNTLGRFDQYMYPFYKKDIENGLLTQDEALELIEEFFISCNKDSDLYTGMQQGDNGQSMMLGGLNPDGSDSFNELSELCLKASLELKLIDPKINLRVSKSTPVERYEKATELTKQGLGFPQYANDDIVIPCLKNWGYKEEDAYNYVVAACWEFIIPGRGMDIPNVNTLSYINSIIDTLDELPSCNTFEDYMNLVHENMNRQLENLMNLAKNIYMEPAPLMSLMMENCVRDCKDISLGNVYNNYGFHGAGLSTAVDSLAAIKKYVYEDKMISAQEMVQMCRTNFEGHEDIQNMLRFEAPKMGNDDAAADEIAVRLLDWFADALEGKKNDRGGIFRAGTGSAMYYVWESKDAIATPDGRRAGEELACNYSPSLFMRAKGPVSIIKSFAKPHLNRVANGGPLTVELTDTMFRNQDSIRKVAMYVKSFIDMGGHQIQLNAVNREKLQMAKEHPENYRNLIVRVWGWSGYFVELEECYQDHIMKRMELTM